LKLYESKGVEGRKLPIEGEDALEGIKAHDPLGVVSMRLADISFSLSLFPDGAGVLSVGPTARRYLADPWRLH